MARMRWSWTGVMLLLLVVPLPVNGQGAAQPPGTDGVDVPLPHLSRINGDGALVQRDGAQVDARVGEHLTFGDRVTTGEAQVQIVHSDGTLVTLDRRATLDLLAPDLLALTDGRLLLVTPRRVTTPLRVDTPAGAISVTEDTDVRIRVEAEIAEVQVVRGAVDVRQAQHSTRVMAGHRLSLRDGLLPGPPQIFNTAAYDSFVDWAREPVVAQERSPSRDYLGDPRLEAYSDVFDRDGQWQQDATYGQVWYPTVGQDWRPYSQGYWQSFGGAYGPTWVGLDPWGWPTHHYGEWDLNPGGRWFWRPGRRWSPGRVSWSVGPGYVGWSPLGPRGDTRWAWSSLGDASRGRGVYRGGTLDPYRAWTVIPTERYGLRGGLSAYAVDARTLSNLNAFVTQRVAPPLRYGGYPYGGYDGYRSPVGVAPGRNGAYGTGYGRRGGYGRRTGDDTEADARRGPEPTRVESPRPGPPGPYVGPTGAAPRADPYERARGVMAPRRPPDDGDNAARPPARRQPPPSAAGAPSRPAEARPANPPPSARPAEAPPERSAPPPRGVASPRRAPADAPPRRAVPRPPA